MVSASFISFFNGFVLTIKIFLLMSLMRLLDAGATANRTVVAGRIETNDIDKFTRMQSTFLALNVLNFNRLGHHYCYTFAKLKKRYENI
jgi:hypothetical protein